MHPVKFATSFALLFSLVTTHVIGQDLNPKDPRWKQLSQAYGFVFGQETSLELIGKKFPDLEKDAKQASFLFNSSALGDSVKGVEAELSAQLGDKWPEMKGKLTESMRETAAKQELSRDQANGFVNEVKLRSKGQLPDPIRAALLSAHPRYSNNPGLELSEGWKQTFRTNGHPKAKGVDVSISLPLSWSKREAERPNIVQVFQSVAGYGPISCTVTVKEIPLPAGEKFTQEDLKDFFKPSELKDMIPESATYIDSKTIVLDGSPAGMLVCDQTKQRLDFTIKMRMTQFITIQNTSMITVGFMVAEIPNSKTTLEELQTKYLPTYRAIMNTFVFTAKYK